MLQAGTSPGPPRRGHEPSYTLKRVQSAIESAWSGSLNSPGQPYLDTLWVSTILGQKNGGNGHSLGLPVIRRRRTLALTKSDQQVCAPPPPSTPPPPMARAVSPKRPELNGTVEVFPSPDAHHIAMLRSHLVGWRGANH